MKKIFLILMAAFTLTALAAEKNVKSVLKTAKVYLSGAELTSNFTVPLEKGENLIVVNDIAENIDPNSIQISGLGDATILSINLNKNFLDTQVDEKIKELTEKLTTLEIEKRFVDSEIEVLNEEKMLLISNKQIGVETKNFVQDLQNLAQYFSKKLTELNILKLKKQDQATSIIKEIQAIKNQISTQQGKKNKFKDVLEVRLFASSNTTAEMELKYFTYSANWAPFYDIKVKEVGKDLLVNYKAKVWQQTGIDWKDIKVILSTASANQNNYIPELPTWFIDFYQPKVNLVAYSPALSKTMRNEEIVINDIEAVGGSSSAKTEMSSNPVQVSSNEMNVEFIPELKYTIVSGQKENLISIKEYNLKATYSYLSIPKLEQSALLVANVSDWRQNQFLQGSANLFFESAFVGTSYFPQAGNGDTLNVSFGKDENIIVKREAVKDFKEDKFLSSNVERFFSYDISIKNSKSKNIEIEVKENIPISKNEEIEIKLLESSDASYNSETGILTWKLKIEAGKTVIIRLSYSVKYPGDKTIEGLNW